MTNTPVTVPPDRNLGDPGHINDHNLLAAGIKTLDSKLQASIGKILQVVRATDTTDRTTTSTSYVDVTGMSVTITPQKSTSALILIGQGYLQSLFAGPTAITYLQITDSSNKVQSGAEETLIGHENSTQTETQSTLSSFTIIGYATPATTSAVTYKMRFKTNGATGNIVNATNTGQMYAIEVSA